ncbi:putative RND efflux membrane fusion protein [Alkalibacterium sp. AK22]|uniref:efflux RND transporter periplasmic adaptor subunit n=1 Tax=Alkalibacterium sp. AK22 TaxID=1229520 RepID=UPI0004468F95|nr:efflux RND transporter periplasmic adaptor subunit [Alkalibacterium sp. AK22]EXJ23551.1 putative RND efflux membrane fusion protein [Alkalibacterium sp. AK22]
MSMKKWIGVAVFLLFVGFVGFSIYQTTQEDQTVTVRSASVEEDSVTEIVATTGVIQPAQMQEVMGQGLVLELGVAVGDSVEEGDTLVTYQDGTSFTANFDGTITEINVAEGEADNNAQQGQASLVLADLNELEVALELSRSDASQIEVDQAVQMDYAGQNFEGTVSFIEPIARTEQTQMGSSSRLGATVAFDSDIDGLIAGFDIDVDIIVASVDNALVIPIEALNFDQNNNPYVFTVEEGVATEVPIETGIQSDARIEVTEGLSEGDQVVLSPDEDLEDGMEVEIEEE